MVPFENLEGVAVTAKGLKTHVRSLGKNMSPFLFVDMSWQFSKKIVLKVTEGGYF